MKDGKKPPFTASGMALYSAILGQLAGSILIGVFCGRYLDHSFQIEPLFLIIGLLLGLATGIWAMLHTVRHFFSGD
ncbi:AtpZ/AtpI family protein [Heyndrickxia acidicola]|uniref:AtpZ/AtpI family protein n=1 Tax=Heyndrickxia acidicola TaxID=209389 RepID=A0ABU6MF54_9BACI|nr:AtpZ/AtpI family protein [Heyndrickxia acidicola]MED1202919.1 AtpZ/AtpI family protein [Heyndrickxia acidicola]